MNIVDAFCNTHSHLREGDVVPDLVQKSYDGGADVLLPMPNTAEGLITRDGVIKYIDELKQAASNLSMGFIPTLMINEETDVDEVFKCVNAGICDAKIYPLDRTTKSHNGVRDYVKLLSLIKYCGKVGMRVHFHPEHPWMLFSNRDAEYAFLPIVDMFLRQTNATIIWEHGTDARCIPFWKEMARTGRFFVTLTAHHLLTDEDEVFGDVRSVCKPSIKTKGDQQSLVALVAEDFRWVMAGADDAPHDIVNKHVHEGKCACGAYTAPFALQLYAHALDSILSIGERGYEVFTKFTSRNARFGLYNLAPTSRRFELSPEPFQIPGHYKIGSWVVEPFWANQILKYSLNEVIE